MKFLTPLLTGFSFLAICGCSVFPHMADELNDPKTLAQTQFQANGVLAFVPQYVMNEDARITMDFTNTDSNKTYRIVLTPELKTQSVGRLLGKVIHEGEIQRSPVSDTVAFVALPVGHYVSDFAYADFGNRRNVRGPVNPVPMEIKANQIVSWGKVLIPFQAGIFTASIPSVKTLDTNTIELIRKSASPLSGMKVTHQFVDIHAKP